ncbi:hypothetical protein AVEN_236229-1 [Araneus ventricosus]|uniref:Post-SET domain-containing protein n=1 Tax=Araneus ventricosus TaxID=182803 RepID=A0A4Y2CB20_ARAVE|nr:hypothetical protein AVEN_236229-1 [Araneus ventricosus]
MHDFKLCPSEKSRKVPLQEQPFITDERSDRAIIIGTVDLQITQQLQKIDTKKVKNQALEKTRFGKFWLDGLKPSEISREENVKVRKNNDVAIGKKYSITFHSSNKAKVCNISKNMRQICSCGSTSCRSCISITS